MDGAVPCSCAVWRGRICCCSAVPANKPLLCTRDLALIAIVFFQNSSDPSLRCRDVPLSTGAAPEATQGQAKPIATPAVPPPGASPLPDCWCGHNPSKAARLVLPNAFCQRSGCLPKPPRFLMGMHLKIVRWVPGTWEWSRTLWSP